MGELIRLSDVRNPWSEVCTVDVPTSTLQVYFNDASGEVELVQTNHLGSSIRTLLSAEEAHTLMETLIWNSRANVRI